MGVLARDEDDGSFSPAEQLDSLGQAVITTDVDGVIGYWNPAAERLYGWPAEEVLGRSIDSVTVPDIAQGTAADIMTALRAGVPWSGSFPVRRRDGRIFTALVTDAGIYRDGELVGIVGVSTHLGAALRPLLERSTDAALVLRADAVVTYAAPSVHELFGWDAESLVGSSFVPLIHADDRAGLAEYLERVVAVPGGHPPLELRLVHGEGWIWAEAAMTNLLDDPGVRGLVCNLRQSVRRAAQEAAELKARQLEGALRSRVVIEQAKGFIAALTGSSPDRAFEVLRHHARSNHLDLHEVCQQVVDRDLALATGRSTSGSDTTAGSDPTG